MLKGASCAPPSHPVPKETDWDGKSATFREKCLSLRWKQPHSVITHQTINRYRDEKPQTNTPGDSHVALDSQCKCMAVDIPVCEESGDRYMNHSHPTWNRLEQHFPNPLRDSSQKLHIFAEINNGKMGRVYDENGNVEQTNNYFAYGGLTNDVTAGTDTQTRKFGGKELDRMHGLDLIDFSARQYEEEKR